jgi:hypothetical protein
MNLEKPYNKAHVIFVLWYFTIQQSNILLSEGRLLILLHSPMAEECCMWLLASAGCTTPVICDVGISTWGLAGAMV